MNTAFHLLGQTYDYSTDSASSGSAGGGVAVIFLLIYLAVIVLLIAAMIKLYLKAGRKWWEAIVPIYNAYVQLKMVGRPGWWLILYFIPLVNIIISIIVMIDLAKSFGRGTGTGLLLVFFPFIMLPVMAFGSSYQYKGPAAATESGPTPNTPPASTPPSNSDTTGPTPPPQTDSPTPPVPPQPPAATPPAS